MEQRSTPTANYAADRLKKNNTNCDHHHYHRRKKRTDNKKREHLTHSTIILRTDIEEKSFDQHQRSSMKTPLAWTKKWSKWFSSCGSDRNKSSSSNIIVQVSVASFLSEGRDQLVDICLRVKTDPITSVC